MTPARQEKDLDLDRIVIYPRDLDSDTRHRLYRALRDLNICYAYEQYA